MGNKNSQLSNLGVSMRNNAIADSNMDEKTAKENAIIKAIIQRYSTDQDLNSTQMRAVVKIQRQARRKNAWKVAQRENQWKVSMEF